MRAWMRGWLLLALMCVVAVAQAGLRPIKPGQVPELGPGEGLVLLAVDTPMKLETATLNHDGRLFSGGRLAGMEPGINYRLYVADAGEYRWRQLTPHAYLGMRYDLRESDEFVFRATAGQLIYPGDLWFRPTGWFSARMRMVNRSLSAMDWLHAQHPVMAARYPLQFSGRYPDPFPAFYREQGGGHDAAMIEAANDLAPPPSPAHLPLDPATLFRQGQVDSVALNRSGDLLAVLLHQGKDDWKVMTVDLRTETSTLVATMPVAVHGLRWVGDRTLLFSVGADGRMMQGLRYPGPAGARGRPESLRLPDGEVVAVLPNDDDHVLFARHAEDGALVQRLDIRSTRAVEASRVRFSQRLNIGLKDDGAWFVDGEGNLRMAIVWRDDKAVLVHGRSGAWTDLMPLDSDGGFQPVALSRDGMSLFALTDEGREQRDLVRYDIAKRSIVETLYTLPGVDISEVLLDGGMQPIGVAWYEGGQPRQRYFDDADAHLAALLGEAFKGRNVDTLARSGDGSHRIIRVDADDRPAQIYHFDVAARRAALVEETAPWLEGIGFASTQLVPFRSADGLAMEAFLTLPPGSTKGSYPLIVHPHGGPVGVADTRHFNPEVQFMASLGYAVLQVNFRGSSGYGRAFRDAGRKGYGSLIEDDIDAAVNAALTAAPLRQDQMCAVGTSYGGYSSMVLAMRWPQRFRCIVSIAGVSDRVLFYTASDTGGSERGRAVLERALGNPVTDMERMLRTSPLYHHDELKAAVMLVHGREDERVDFEHARRMARMLTLSGRPPVGLVFDKDGHGNWSPDNEQALWKGVAGFLQQHLPASATDISPGQP